MFLSRRWRRGERLLLAEHAAGGPRRRRGGRRPTPLRYLLERRPRGRQPGDARRRGRERGRRGAVKQRGNRSNDAEVNSVPIHLC